MHSDASVSAFPHFQVAPEPQEIPISSTKTFSYENNKENIRELGYGIITLQSAGTAALWKAVLSPSKTQDTNIQIMEWTHTT